MSPNLEPESTFFFLAMGYYRVFAESSPKKLVQAHNLHPSMLPRTAGLQDKATVD
jgi:folate-dependent phosphoribosylglycinamide formyltransferase PurN